jgi:hypothetical protein
MEVSASWESNMTYLDVSGCRDIEEIIERLREDGQLDLPENCGNITLYTKSKAEIPSNMSVYEFFKVYDSQKPFPFKVAFEKKRRIISSIDCSAQNDDSKRISDLLKLGHFLEGKKLVTSRGKNLNYSDRTDPFRELCESLIKRFGFIKTYPGRLSSDRNCHEIPILAAGRGWGKTRFLDELKLGLFNFIESRKDLSSEVMCAIQEAVSINISFGDGSLYDEDDVLSGIEKALCKRILSQVCDNYTDFVDSFEPIGLKTLFNFCISSLATNSQIVILGVDEVNKVHEKDPRAFENLIDLLGSMSCRTDFLFCPIISGSNIGDIKRTVIESTYLPLYLSLPPIGLREAENLFIEYLNNSVISVRLKEFISDLGGNCRMLEWLFEALEDNKSQEINSEGFLMRVISIVVEKVKKTYNFEEGFKIPICYAFLAETVSERGIAYDTTTFLNLAEEGLITLEQSDPGYSIRIPFIFVSCYLLTVKPVFSKLWTNLLFEENDRHLSWKIFNRNYLAIKLSMHQILGRNKILISKLFHGSVMGVPFKFGKIIDIPKTLRILALDHDFSKDIQLQSGDILTSTSDKSLYDCLVYLQTSNDSCERVLIALESRHFYTNRSDTITNSLVNDISKKVESLFADKLMDGELYVVMLFRDRLDKEFDIKKISKTAMVTLREQSQFYGSFLQRLNPNI